MACVIAVPVAQVLLCGLKQLLFNSAPEIQCYTNIISFGEKKVKVRRVDFTVTDVF